ncbi:MAG: uroporphyrinogen-III synthase [Bacteroidota bacterium]|jgi:uroporphyrinogen-III synthase|nr:uroporphyrinogen-III synthase [Bacteroidota bacterium]NLP19542.1 uroporphyrinogen-III synthase [Bacteroidales bacterium]
MKIKSVLISQPKPETEKSPYFDISKKYNVKIDFRPFVQVKGIPAKDVRRSKVDLCSHTAIIFNSRTAIDHYFRVLNELKININDEWKYFCYSESIALYLQKYITYRKRKIFFGNGTFNDLMESIKRFPEENYLVPLSEVHKPEIPIGLDKANIKYSKAILYKTVSADLSDLEDINYDVLVFFSPAGVNSLLHNFPNFEQNGTCIGAFGTATAKTVKDLKLRLDLCAPSPESPSMTAALEEFIKTRNK